MPATRKHFSEDLQDLYQELLKMGTLVEETIRKAISALKTQNSALAAEVLDDDDAVNCFEKDIQDRCIILLATEQPVASDLRSIVTAIKVATQLERIGDHAVHVAKSAILMADQRYLKPLIDIPRMGEICISMIHEILSALVENDPEQARAIAARDDEVDELNDQISRKMFNSMLKDPQVLNQGLELIFVSRFMERMGDHVTNIAELVVYNATGNHVELNR